MPTAPRIATSCAVAVNEAAETGLPEAARMTEKSPWARWHHGPALSGFRLSHPATHAVMMMVVVTHLVRICFGQCRGRDGKRDSGDGQNLCSEFHYFFLC